MSTADCDEKISREHFISDSIMRTFVPEGRVAVSGHKWQPPREMKTVSTASLTAKILCRRHNSALAPLDDALGSLAQALKETTLAPDSQGRHQLRLFCGEDLEQGLLKVLSGLLASGTVRPPPISPELVPLLLGTRRWPQNWGLYVGAEYGTLVHQFPSTILEILIHADSLETLGMLFVLHGLPLLLVVSDHADTSALGIYRPRALVFHDEEVRYWFEISWSDPRHDRAVGLRYEGRFHGAPPDWQPWERGD